MGIGACGHQAIKHGMLLKVFASCQPNQKATLGSFVAQKGILFKEEDCSIYFHNGKKLSDTQNAYGLNLTKTMCVQLEGPTRPCQFPDISAKFYWKWEDTIALEWKERPSSLMYTVRGQDRGWDAWHIVFVKRELLEDFRKKISTGSIDVANYGYVIESGWGKNPPDDIIKKLSRYSPG